VTPDAPGTTPPAPAPTAPAPTARPAAASTTSPAGGDTTAAADDHRLPYGAAPRRYELWLAPDLGACRFTGTARIDLEVLEPIERIVMNAAELELRDAVLTPGWPVGAGEAPAGGAGAQPAQAPVGGSAAASCRIELHPELERVSFVPAGRITPGRYRLACSFDGVLNDRLRGFYRSVFTGEDGSEQVIATTQFEQTDARRAFPCFDEPDRKAVFSVALDEPPGMLAISNGAEVEAIDLPGGGRRVRFSDTMPMSTYLVAFVVGPLEATKPVDAGGVPVRIVHTPGRGHLVQPAIDAAVHALAYFEDYFGLPYPGDKVDLVALPDFAAGAMENLGCITFRDAILLADPARAGRRDLQRLAEVVEHELAHMWFGDLVTMRWWNGIWLNEAFATFMSLRCLDDYHPEWDVFVGFAPSRASAQSVDGLHSTRPIEYEVRRPDEVAAMFDVLTYEKGASVLWMIEQYLGADRFRDGVRRYLIEHRYGNTETHDLWDALQAASADLPAASDPAGGVPAGQIMDSWIFQGGYPLVTVGAPPGKGGGIGADSSIELSQQPFSYLPGEEADRLGLVERSAIGDRWLLPLLVRDGGGGPASRVLLRGETTRLARAGSGTPLLNAGGSGFYRLRYAPELRGELLGALGELETLERYDVVSDIWAAVVAGHDALPAWFEVVAHLGTERDPDVWSLVASVLATFDLVATSQARPLLRDHVAALLGPRLAELGWTPGDGEGERTPLLRATLVATLGNVAEDPAVIAAAKSRAGEDLRGGTPLDPDLATAVLSVLAAHADREEFDAVLARWRRSEDPMDAVRHLYSLGGVRDPAFADELLDLSISEVRTQNAPYLLRQMLANRHIAPRTWDFIRAHFAELERRFPESSIHRMLEGLPALAEIDASGRPRHLDGVLAFYREHVHGGRRRLVAQSIERLAVNLRLAERARGELATLLEGA
jgi:puromycin-sensitive aminopeptidase